MRDPHVRFLFLVLILSVPALIGTAAHSGPDTSQLSPTRHRSTSLRPAAEPVPLVCGIEALLVAGIAYAGRERQRLLASRTESPDGA